MAQMSSSGSAADLDKRIAKSSQDQIEQVLFQAADKRIADLNKTGVAQGLTDISEPKCQHQPVLVNMGYFAGWTHEDLADKGGKTWELETDRRLRRMNRELTREKIEVNDILKDIRTHDGSTRKCRHVMFIGPAGSGKTTLLRRIAQGKYGMLKDKLLINADIRTFSVDKKILPSQGLLGSTFSDWESEQMDQRYQWVLKNSEKVGFFVDSLDTLPFDLNSERPPIAFDEPATPDVILHNLLAKELFSKSFIISSSREFKVRNMHPTVRPDRCILLDGLEEESVRDLIDGFLGKDKGAEMKKYIDNECPDIWPLLSIPVFLVFSTISFAQDGFKPKTMSGILIKYFLCLIRSPHALEKEILSVLYKLMPMSFEGIRKGQVLFTLEDLMQFELTPHQVRDLTSLIPQSHGTGLSSKLMQNDRFFLYFNHQTQQETLSALHVLSMGMKEFKDFVQLELYVVTFGVVRRLVCGILLNGEVLEATKELTEIADIDQKKTVLLESLRMKLKQNSSGDIASKMVLLELFIDLNEAKEAVGEVIRSSVRDINLLGISLSPSDIQAVAFVMKHSEHMGKVNLYGCNLTARKMEIIDATVMQSNLKFRELDVSDNKKLGPEGMRLLGELVKNHDVKEVVAINCNPNEENVQKFAEGLGEAKFDSLDLSHLSIPGHLEPVYAPSFLNLLPQVNEEIKLRGWKINENQQRELQDKLNEICSPTLTITLGDWSNLVELRARNSETVTDDGSESGIEDDDESGTEIKDAIAKEMPDKELQQLDFQFSPRSTGQLADETDLSPTTTTDMINEESMSATIVVKNDEAETTGTFSGDIPDDEIHQQLEFQYSPLSIDKKVGPEGDNLFVDKCSLAIPSNSVVDTQNLSISMLMDFQNLDLPADKIPVSPYFDVNFCGKLRIPAKARIPTWFMPSEDSEHGIKIYKRYRDEENKFTWCELPNEVTVHDKIIEFEVDHFCGFIAMIPDWHWGNGKIKLSHGLFNLERNFESVFCYDSPESLFKQNVFNLEKKGYKEIYSDIYVMNPNQSVPVRIECDDVDLHKFSPPQRLLSPSDIKCTHTVRFPFVLKHLKEPKDEVDIIYKVDDVPAPFVVKLASTKGGVSNANITEQSKANNSVAANSAVAFKVYGDGATFNIEGGVGAHAGGKGDVSTVIASITNQGTGDNFVSGSQKNAGRGNVLKKAHRKRHGSQNQNLLQHFASNHASTKRPKTKEE